MKASIKFREEQKPLVRAKVPIKMLSLPLQSGVVMGESKEMSLNLSTSLDSGPCLKFSYRPNDSLSPFSFVCKMGVGHFGSPNSSPFVMSAEFNLLGGQNPRFFIRFKPRIGDFSAKKSCSSVDFVKDVAVAATRQPQQGVVKNGGFKEIGFFGNGKVGVFPVDSVAAETTVAAVEKAFSGIKLSASTVLPVGNRAMLKLRWGVRAPPETMAGEMVVLGKGGDRTVGIFPNKFTLPLLVLDKLGIEPVTADHSRGKKGPSPPVSADVAGMCLDMKQQLEVIQAENGLLRKALDDLRADITPGKWSFPSGGAADVSKSSGAGRADRRERKSNEAAAGGGFGETGLDMNGVLK